MVVAVIPVNTTAEQRERLFTELYENTFPSVARFVSHRNGSLQDAKDIFQDALVIFFEKSMEGDLKINISDEAYVLGIAKHLWIRKFNRNKNNISLSEIESAITIPEDFYPGIESNKLLNLVELAGKKCMELLKAFYYDKSSAREIAQTFGYSSEHSATVQKFKCLEKMRDVVKEKSMNYEDFTE